MQRTARLTSSTKKTVNIMLGIMVLAGITTLLFMDRTNTDGELMSRLFLIFFGFIITVQIIPGLFLFGGMMKEVLGFNRKQTVQK